MISTSVRLLTNLVLFVVLAHVWGPAAFGVFMYPYAIAAILVRIVDYGFTLQIARDVGRAPDRTHEIVGRALGAKLLLLAPTIATSVIVAMRLPDGPPYALLLALLVVDALATSFALFLSIPMRALGRFDREASVTIGGNLTFFGATMTAVAMHAGPVAVAVIFLLARLVFVGLACRGYMQLFGGRPHVILDRRALTETLSKGFPYAVHVVVGTLSLQVDALVIQQFMGASAVGLHQAGMRLFLGALVVGDALHNVFFASLVRVAHDAPELGRQATRMTRHFVALGMLAFACLIGGAQTIVKVLFDTQFATLADLLPLFGLAVLVRYAGLAYGAVLTLAERQAVRVLAAGGVLVMNVALAVVLVPRFGIAGALIASTLADLVLHVVCATASWIQYRDLMIDRRAVVLLLCAAASLPITVPGMADQALRSMSAVLLAAAALIVGPTGSEWNSLSRVRGPSARAIRARCVTATKSTRYTMNKLLGALPLPGTGRDATVAGEPSAAQEGKTRYNVLDLLRIVAATAAMIYHYAFRGYAADGLSVVRFDDLSPIVRYGHVGSFFFLISSFVISLSAERRSAGAFLNARLRRLVPAFWICCLLTTLASWLFAQPQFSVTLLQLLGHLTMVRVFAGSIQSGLIDGAYWTLQIELRFYLLVGLLLWWRPGRLGSTLPRVMAAGLVLSVVNFLVIMSGRDGVHVLNFVPLFASGVAYGAVAQRRASVLEWMLLATAVPLSLAYAAHDATVLSAHYRVYFSPVILAATLGAFQAVLFLVTVVRVDIPPSRILRSLGMLTYPLFLLHQNVGYMILNASAGRVPPMVVLGALCVGMPLVAYVIGRSIEPRVRTVLDRSLARLEFAWSSRRRASPATTASSTAPTSAAA